MLSELRFPPSLGSDNHSGVHPRVMDALLGANRGHAHSYGLDELSELTKHEFTRVFGRSTHVDFVFNGTAANVLSLTSVLKPFESAVCSSLAHLHLDECSAPEKFHGTKLYLIDTEDGKIRPEQIEPFLERRGDQHYAQPRLLSLTLPTECGVVYSLEELKALRTYTRDRGLLLHIDGTRLANAAVHLNTTLAALTADLGVDVVSFGGTKNGLMGAEAVLIFNDEFKSHFKYHRKQAMQLSSKTRFLAAQFYAYLKDDLWREIASHVTREAQSLARRLTNEHPDFEIQFPVQSNALFVRVPAPLLKPLRERFFFYIWDQKRNLGRWMINFDWTQKHSDSLLEAIREVKKNVL